MWLVWFLLGAGASVAIGFAVFAWYILKHPFLD